MKVNGVNVKNESGVLGARKGIWSEQKSVFTHRNPKTGMVWGEDLHGDDGALGRWVPYDEVEWLS